MRAVAILSDNSTKDVTAEAFFSSTRPEIATLTPQGVLTGVAPGTAGLHVDYHALSNDWPMAVEGPEIVAFVHENSARNVCLAGARVQLDGDTFKGEVLTADNDGRVGIPNWQTAPFTLTISKPGYTPAQVTLPQFPRNPTLDIAMTPAARIVDRVWDGTFAPDQCDYSNLQGGKRSFLFTAAADGVLVINRVEMKVLDVGGWSVLRGPDRLPVDCPSRAGTIRAVYSIARGAQYELQVRGFGCGPNPPYGGFYDGSFHVEFSRPE